MLCQSEQQMSRGESYSFRVLQNRPILIAEEGLKLTDFENCRQWKSAVSVLAPNAVPLQLFADTTHDTYFSR